MLKRKWTKGSENSGGQKAERKRRNRGMEGLERLETKVEDKGESEEAAVGNESDRRR